MEILEMANIGCVYLPEHLYCDSLSSSASFIDRAVMGTCVINAPNYIWKS